MQSPWTEDRLVQLARWWNAGHSGGIIAEKFCADGFVVSRSAVIGKVTRLDLVRRKPRKQFSQYGDRRIMTSDTPRKKQTKPLGRPPSNSHATPVPKPIVEFGPRVSGLGALAGCAWIEGDPRTPGWFYCNAPARGSYCEAHAAMCRRGTASGNPAPVTSKRSKFGHYLSAEL